MSFANILEVWDMMIRGKEIASMRELWANFAIDDLINAYYSGELEFFLRKCGEDKRADMLAAIPHNAYLLMQLYEILELDPKLTEEDIRPCHA